jgi:hypothetical protein
MSSQSKAQSRQNEVRFGAPRCLPHGYHRIYINVEVAGEVWNVTGLTGLGGADARYTKGGVAKSRLASAWRCRAWRLASTSSGGASPPSPALRASSPRRTRNAAFAAHEITRKGSGGSDVVERGGRGGDEGLARTSGGCLRRTRRKRGKMQFALGSDTLDCFLKRSASNV